MVDLADLKAPSVQRSLERVQSIEPASVVLAKHGQYSFEDAVEPVSRLVSLFRQLPSSSLGHFPQQQLEMIQNLSDSVFSVIQEIKNFDLEAGDNTTRRQNLIAKLDSLYQGVFTQLFPLVAYAVARTADLGRLEIEQQAALQRMRDESQLALAQQQDAQAEIERVLDDVRRVASEQGVTQQAIYFKNEADRYEAQSRSWRRATVTMAVAVGLFGLIALFLPKWTWLAPTNSIELVQYTLAKVLMFSVLVFMLIFCSRNFLANRHNEAVNRHRQNALLTYKVLVDAGSNGEARDIILNHAASAIYKLHETGFTRSSESSGGSSASVIEMLPKASMPVSLG
ncbi:hypothetical protein [Rubellimicrobium mesophilum]|uniref:hypothetical protein n=1 Tax=Rubellimicrobium mesophilum TaxID=1123067 RepID=UPI0012E20F09|nr:hypothetical protein [Rubellimicrobium mesophilum]